MLEVLLVQALGGHGARTIDQGRSRRTYLRLKVVSLTVAYVTAREARTAATSAGVVLATKTLRESAAKPLNTTFDIFLSHSAEDAEVIAGLKAMLERDGLSVYVDWLEDPQADRSRVTPQTAHMLRTRMNSSRYLLYASSTASSSSKWMPWELGYFDGRRPGHVGILPIVATSDSPFKGLEYLGLYPLIERINFTTLGHRFGRYTGSSQGETLGSIARS